jgi:hypothetical protein
MKNKLYEKNSSHCSVGGAAYRHKFRGGTGADLHIPSDDRNEFSAYSNYLTAKDRQVYK